MQKTEFLDRLRAALADLPAEELEKTLGYYAEMIEDRMEDGMDEEAAVAAMGDPEAVAREILLDAPLGTLVRAKIKPKRALSGWGILLLVLGVCAHLVADGHALGSVRGGAVFGRRGGRRQRVGLDAERIFGIVCTRRRARLLRLGHFRAAGDEGAHGVCRPSDRKAAARDQVALYPAQKRG